MIKRLIPANACVAVQEEGEPGSSRESGHTAGADRKHGIRRVRKTLPANPALADISY